MFFKASGAKVDNECKTVFQDVKLGRKYRYVIFGFNDSDLTTIAVLKKEESMQSLILYPILLKCAARNICRCAIIDCRCYYYGCYYYYNHI